METKTNKKLKVETIQKDEIYLLCILCMSDPDLNYFYMIPVDKLNNEQIKYLEENSSKEPNPIPYEPEDGIPICFEQIEKFPYYNPRGKEKLMFEKPTTIKQSFFFFNE